MAVRMGYWYHPPSATRPKPVEGKRNKKFGLTPWGRRWIEVVETEGDEARLSRGRAYARAERVYDIKFDKGKVAAKVKGNSGTYTVSAEMRPFSKADWKRIAVKLQQGEVAGSFLNIELPDDIDKCIGVPLIDHKLTSDCSCPDWGDPCKHVAALYYVLGDEIDKAPLILFALRGISKKALQSAIIGSDTEKTGSDMKKSSVRQKKTVKKKRNAKKSN